MWFRLLIAGLALGVAGSVALAAPKPYRVSLIGDAFDGRAWHTGVLVELEPGWKTYWRMPGDSGVPPEFSWTTSHPAQVDVAFPTPSRHYDQSGEAVGYQGQVLFPVTVVADAAGAAELDLGLRLFFAVCKNICIPAEATASITLGREERDPVGNARLDAARTTIPVAGEAVSLAKILQDGGKPVLQLTLTERPEDVFVESPSSAYFQAPQVSADGREARLAIGNLTDPAKLAGSELKLTYIIGGRGYEQSVTLR